MVIVRRVGVRVNPVPCEKVGNRGLIIIIKVRKIGFNRSKRIKQSV